MALPPATRTVPERKLVIPGLDASGHHCESGEHKGAAELM
jgi:hypothetical protein